MKRLFLVLCFIGTVQLLCAQEDSTSEAKGFKKENLFVGGSVSFSFGSNSFQIGGNPMIGYSLTKWADAGLIINYIYTSYTDYSYDIEKVHQNLYGGGAFLRLYPVRFLFAQGQLEKNFIATKYILTNGGAPVKDNRDATSLLVGAGYTTGREPGSGGAYGYLSILFDVMNDKYSPYTDNVGNKLPIIRAGLVVYPFQRKNRDW